MRYAHLENNTVIDVVGNDPFAVFQHAYASKFIECPDEVEHHWILDGDNWLPPQPKELTQQERALIVQQSLEQFAKQKDIDIAEIPMLLNSTNAEWRAEAERFQSLYLATWDAFYNDQPLPELTWL